MANLVIDPEIDAMQKVLGVLAPLEQETQVRILNWIAKKLNIKTDIITEKCTGGTGGGGKGEEGSKRQEGDGDSTYNDFAELCTEASPDTDVEKALVAGYWFQVCKGQENFTSQECNDALKDFGTPVANITRAFDGLKAQKPALAMQLQKSGANKQGRKKMKLTHKGVDKVKSMIGANVE